uniref:Uncharacterized protein n=1 Tax=Calidris pygmaea TaxID=425635 RepID=A0A8C3KWF2_9CHAR
MAKKRHKKKHEKALQKVSMKSIKKYVDKKVGTVGNYWTHYGTSLRKRVKMIAIHGIKTPAVTAAGCAWSCISAVTVNSAIKRLRNLKPSQTKTVKASS